MDPEGSNSSSGGLKDLECVAVLRGESLARKGNPSICERDAKSTQRERRRGLLQGQPEITVDLADRREPRYPKGPFGLLNEGVFTQGDADQVPDQFLDDVLQSDDAGHATVFVDDHDKMNAPDAHVIEEIDGGRGLGHEDGLREKRLKFERCVVLPQAWKDLPPRYVADDVLCCPVEHGKAMMSVTNKGAPDDFAGGVLREGDDKSPMDHDISGCEPAEIQRSQG